MQAGCLFADGDFAGEVASGRLKSSSLERYTCVALSGVCSEYLQFGKAEGGKADVQQLDGMLRALQVRSLVCFRCSVPAQRYDPLPACPHVILLLPRRMLTRPADGSTVRWRTALAACMAVTP